MPDALNKALLALAFLLFLIGLGIAIWVRERTPVTQVATPGT